MDEDTVTVEWLRIAASKSSLAEIRPPLKDAADAIERLQKELAHKKSAYDYAYEKWADAAKERDAALAEVELLKQLKPGVAERCASCDIKILPDHVVLCQDCRS